MIVTYKQIIKDSIELANHIKNNYVNRAKEYKAIHGIPAGGIATAVVMAHVLNIDNILSAEDYKNYENKSEVLVVDDLVDSGATLKKFSESDCAVVYKKPHSPQPTYYYKDIESGWVEFPHEKDKAGILDHIIRVFSYIDVQLSDEEQQLVIQLLNKIKNK